MTEPKPKLPRRVFRAYFAQGVERPLWVHLVFADSKVSLCGIPHSASSEWWWKPAADQALTVVPDCESCYLAAVIV